MKYVFSFLIIVTILSISFIACDDDEFIPCEYNRYYGNAEIIDIVDREQSYDVYFIFTPDDTTMRAQYYNPNCPDTNSWVAICHGDSAWLEDQNLIIGEIHRCNRYKITKGTCPPCYFELLGIDCPD